MYLSPEQRMKISLRRHEAESTGKPLYKDYSEVPMGYVSKTICQKIKLPVQEKEVPAAYVLNRLWNGYLPLYDRRECF